MAKLEIGAAKVDVTPPVGVDLTGFGARPGPSKGIHKPLFARVLVLKADDKKAAVVGTDVLGFGVDSVRRIREGVEKRTGIPGSRVMVTATHTHSGPATIFLRRCGEICPEYLRSLEMKVVGAIEMAEQNLREAVWGSEKGEVPVCLNRRHHSFRAGDDPRSDRVGVVDRACNVLRFDTTAGEPIGSIINYACHAVALGAYNLSISPDYPGEASCTVERELGGVALFLNGACGNINPIMMGTDPRLAERIGRAVGGEALKCLELARLSPEAELVVKSRTIRLPLQPYPPIEELAAERRKNEDELRALRADAPFWERNLKLSTIQWASELAQALQTGTAPSYVEAEIQLLSLGKACLVATPGEVFVEIGMQIKALDPSRHIFVVGYANGCLGYISTDQAIDEGGYEPDAAARWYAFAPLAKGAEHLVVSAAKELLA